MSKRDIDMRFPTDANPYHKQQRFRVSQAITSMLIYDEERNAT